MPSQAERPSDDSATSRSSVPNLVMALRSAAPVMALHSAALLAILVVVLGWDIRGLAGLSRGLHSAASNTTGKSHTSETSTCSCLKGSVPDCCCTYADLAEANLHVVHPLLKRIVATPFFSHFKIDLCSECELWKDNSQCMLRDCGVCECESPPRWALATEECAEQVDDRIITGASSHIVKGWPGSSHNDEDAAENTEVVVDLRSNPERYTGYTGESAAKVWAAIHGENCFQPVGDDAEQSCLMPGAQRVYNRLLSGLHSSISLHIAHDYCLESGGLGECARWGPSPAIAAERVLQHRDRVENLYAAHAILLRAVVKAGDAITAAVPRDDVDFAEGQREWEHVLLPEVRKMALTCPRSFNETELLLSPDAGAVGEELLGRFQHLQEIMKCVGCDRCKLWGTLQALGLGTALRVLYSDEAAPVLSRQEAVALVHTLERLSSSLVYVRELAIEAQA